MIQKVSGVTELIANLDGVKATGIFMFETFFTF